jgi:predicted transcriptional regulator
VKDKAATPATVIPIDAAKRKLMVPGKTIKESERMWSKDVMDQKFVIVPKLLLRAQAKLGLDATQLNVILHLVEHWWHAERQPYPSKKTMAVRMGVHQRTIQRAIAAMEKHGLVTRRLRHSARSGRKSNIYDLSGLVARLKALAPEFKKEAEAAAARRRAIEKPGRRAVGTTTE